jgi:hypothetical protein
MSKRYDTRYEYMTEKKADWLSDFADDEAKKLAQQNNMSVDELKTAGRMDNILDIVERRKKQSVADKVQSYRELVGLDLITNLEKEGGKEISASRMPLSLRDKFAQNTDQKQLMDNIKQYVDEVIKNRNGIVATPALLEQLEHYMRLDKEWLRTNYEAIEKIIEDARNQFNPQTYNELPISDLARTDDPSKGENREQPLFLPPASGG